MRFKLSESFHSRGRVALKHGFSVVVDVTVPSAFVLR